MQELWFWTIAEEITQACVKSLSTTGQESLFSEESCKQAVLRLLGLFSASLSPMLYAGVQGVSHSTLGSL